MKEGKYQKQRENEVFSKTQEYPKAVTMGT
jgi:hypothetical protein